jgi:hypothetical protein
MKVTGIVFSFLFGGWVILTLIMVWGDLISWSNYIKVTLTLGIIAIGVVTIGVILNEIVRETKMRKDKYLD